MNPAATLSVVELRRYALHPGGRDVLIPLFEREFIESQERCGMVPIGHYRDLDDPNSFVWFRGFADMETRRRALEAFYTSPSWMDHRDAANATMIDSDNVLLLRPARPESGFETDGLFRRAGGGREGIALARSQMPNLILLDLMMPDLTGFDVVEALRAEEATRSIPIMVLTAKELTEHDKKALNGQVAAIFQRNSVAGTDLIAWLRGIVAQRQNL